MSSKTSEAAKISAADKPVRDVMSAAVLSVDRNDSAAQADEIMRNRQIRHLPVLREHGRLAGVISQLDIYHAALGSVMKYGEQSQRNYLSTIPVKDILQEPVVTISPEATLRQAAGLMLDHKIGCLPVLDGVKLVGMITESDLLQELRNS